MLQMCRAGNGQGFMPSIDLLQETRDPYLHQMQYGIYSTKNMNDFMQALNDLQSFLLGGTPFVIVFLCGLIFGYVVKSIPFITNRIIPLLVVVMCSILFRFTEKIADDDFQKWYKPEIRLYMIGGLIGFASWIAHNKYLKKWVDEKWFNGNNGNGQEKPDQNKT